MVMEKMKYNKNLIKKVKKIVGKTYRTILWWATKHLNSP